jgi:hypothetical protein
MRKKFGSYSVGFRYTFSSAELAVSLEAHFL